jgi:plastocyanin
MKIRVCLALSLLALGLVGCGSTSSSTSSSSSAPAAQTTTATTAPATSTSGLAAGGTLHVVMKNLTFRPQAVNAKAGDSIVFANQDAHPHNVTWVSGPKFTSSPTLNTGASYSITVSQSGVIHYFCSIHPYMKGTILVTK